MKTSSLSPPFHQPDPWSQLTRVTFTKFTKCAWTKLSVVVSSCMLKCQRIHMIHKKIPFFPISYQDHSIPTLVEHRFPILWLIIIHLGEVSYFTHRTTLAIKGGWFPRLVEVPNLKPWFRSVCFSYKTFHLFIWVKSHISLTWIKIHMEYENTPLKIFEGHGKMCIHLGQPCLHLEFRSSGGWFPWWIPPKRSGWFGSVATGTQSSSGMDPVDHSNPTLCPCSIAIYQG